LENVLLEGGCNLNLQYGVVHLEQQRRCVHFHGVSCRGWGWQRAMDIWVLLFTRPWFVSQCTLEGQHAFSQRAFAWLYKFNAVTTAISLLLMYGSWWIFQPCPSCGSPADGAVFLCMRRCGAASRAALCSRADLPLSICEAWSKRFAVRNICEIATFCVCGVLWYICKISGMVYVETYQLF